MINIGIEIEDGNYTNINLNNLDHGNPGIGGSEYLFALLAKCLSEEDFNITVFHYGNNLLPYKVTSVILNDNSELINSCERFNVDILICQVGKNEKWYRSLLKSDLKVIVWAHIYPDYKEIKSIEITDNVRRIVFVGKEQYDSYIDNDIIHKSTYIYNMIPTSYKPQKRVLTAPTVTYVGSLVHAKGFHILAKVWKKILRKVPDAQLYVIGNGKVYDRFTKLGRYGIAEENYEKSFIHYLTDFNGNILPSVHFLGLMGPEKNNIFNKTSVGVVNPSGLSETFCMSAVEMEYSFIPIVTLKKWGLLDTVKDKKTGLLYYTKNGLVKNIVRLLKTETLNNALGNCAHEFVVRNFTTDIQIKNWVILIRSVYLDEKQLFLKPEQNFLNDLKWLKWVIRKIRIDFGFHSFPSYLDLKNFFKVLFK